MSAGSFTQRILAELASHPSPLSCCRSAFVEGMELACGGEIVTARLVAARAALQSLHQAGIDAHVERIRTPRSPHYRVAVTAGSVAEPASERLCCARSRLRGAFITSGRVNRPDSSPHVEIDCAEAAAAHRLAGDALSLGIPVTVVERRRRWLVLARSAESVAGVLSSIGAQSGRLEFEDGRVVREVRGGVNRRLNAETANLRRTARAGVAQMAAIEALMRDPLLWAGLPSALHEAAAIRLRLPGEPLDRLAAEAGCSRSAMAGRLHRLTDLAGRLTASEA